MKPQIKTLRPKYEAPVITGFDLSLKLIYVIPPAIPRLKKSKLTTVGCGMMN